ncbi:MAG: Serine/threonine-protein kinase pkn3 [Myxococcaceae bacterium]|nr:Serine/threonine-protein kinase pkn3 [Myxococcaceae bacterium]
MTSPAIVDCPVRPGDVLAGKYRIERELGRGGMGVVMSAFHAELDERVAIKFLLHQDPSSVDRFLREARAASKIKCEHVARIYDVGRLEGQIPYIVMEYLVGEDLDGRIARDGVFQPTPLVDILLEAIEAIAEAHAAGIVHRDLKPSNIFLARRVDGTDCVKLLDFGVAKVPDAGGTMTQTSTVMGTPFFMSPEQLISAKDADPRTDIWSLGVILYVLLTGAYPFFAESIVALAIMVREEPVPAPTEKRPDLPPGIEKVILRCLEKDRKKRYPDVAALAEDLAPFASDELRPTIARIRRVVSSGTRSSASGVDTVPGVGAVDALGATLARPSDPEMPIASVVSPKSSAPALATSHVATVRGQEAVSEVTTHDTPRRKSGLTWAIGLAIVGVLGLVAVKARPIAKDDGPVVAASMGKSAEPTPSSVPLALGLPTTTASATPSATAGATNVVPIASAARAVPSASVATSPHGSAHTGPATGLKPAASSVAVVPPSAVAATSPPPVAPPPASASGRTIDRTSPW